MLRDFFRGHTKKLFNLEVPLDVLLRDIRRRLSVEDGWWQPTPLMPLGDPDLRRSEDLDASLDAYFDALLDTLASPSLREDVKRLWRARLTGD